jgi:predicted ATPase
MVGHQDEFAQVLRAIEAVKAGHNFLGLIEGEAGIGKSTFLLQWSKQAAAGGVRLLRGAGESIHGTTPYFVWQGIVHALLGLADHGTPEERRSRFSEVIVGRDWERLAPLLNDVLDLGIPDNADHRKDAG